MTETPERYDTRHPNTGELYPPHHPAHLFTTEEIEDILRFANELELPFLTLRCDSLV